MEISRIAEHRGPITCAYTDRRGRVRNVMMVQTTVPMVESSLVAEARRVASALSGSQGFTETERGHIALIVTELGTNLVKHAFNGQVLMRVGSDEQDAAFEVVAIDSGPGMAEPSRYFRDGQSTTGTSGTGLGAITRLAAEWDFHTTVGKGTVLVARVRAKAAAPRMRLGVIQQAQAGESECGDAWYVRSGPDGWTCVVADGLGHGPLAAKASRAAIAAIQDSPHASVCESIELAHQAAMPTRGLALGVARLNRTASNLSFAGVGNIGAVVIEEGRRRGLVSSNGIVGHNMRKPVEMTHTWGSQAVLVMHSDGLLTQWDLSDYPGLLSRDPSVIAGVLLRDFSRRRDDVTIVVVKDS
jgi:anti-sigma regulatory factor (Ser/Thr protein kinase)